MLLRKLADLAIPVSIALAAFLHARAVGALVGARLAPSSVAAFAEARATARNDVAARALAARERSADAILSRNPFDHVAAAHGTTAVYEPDGPPPCDGVRATVAVRAEDVAASFAALQVDGRRLLRKAGGGAGPMRVVEVTSDRVYLEQEGRLCVARVFAPTAGEPVPPIIRGIARTGTNEREIDRSTVERILEAPAELLNTPLVPVREGDRVVGFRLLRIKPGTILAALGLENGDRLVAINGVDVTSTEKMMEAYARLRTGTSDRFQVQIMRSGSPVLLDYVVR